MDTNVREGLWRLADPKISITSAASMAIGTAVATNDGPIAWFWLAALGIAMFCMEVAKNAWGDVFDYDSGTDLAVEPADRTSFSGGKRVMVDGILSRGQTWAIAVGFALGGLTLGAMIVFLREPQIFWIGLLGLALGWSYHGPPLQLAYRGLGELDVVLCYGPIIAVATHLMLTGSYSAEVLCLSIPLGILTAAFLWVNEFPDYDADRSAKKYNLVARIGKRCAARLLPFIYLVAFGFLLILPMIMPLPRTIWLGFLALPLAAVAARWVWLDPNTFYRHKPVQPFSLLAFVLYSVGVSTGMLIGG